VKISLPGVESDGFWAIFWGNDVIDVPEAGRKSILPL